MTINKDGTEYEIRIRKLTENECYKLMGMTSKDCDKCKDVGISKTQLYKTAGNGLITNCITLLMEHLYKAQYDSNYECTDERILREQATGNFTQVTE